MLKLCVPSILPHLTALINAISSSQFLTSWKISSLLKIYLPLHHLTPNPLPYCLKWPKLRNDLPTINFSPISSPTSYLLPTKHATARDISTQTALLGVLDNIRKVVEDCKVTLLILLGFSNAFDCIPHKELRLKLRKYNLSDSSTTWLRSYFISCHQTIDVCY